MFQYMIDWVKNKRSDSASHSRSKFYLAVTRVKYRVAFEHDYNDKKIMMEIKLLGYSYIAPKGRAGLQPRSGEQSGKSFTRKVAAIESITEFIKVTLQMFFAQSVISALHKSFRISNHSVEPT